MENQLTEPTQDYLKAIYELSRSHQIASTNDLADKLGISPASVTGMVQRLASSKPPLVNYRKHQGVTLTKPGERAALEVIRHHRLLETYLVESLGYGWDEVHVEAERLEHAISEEFESRIAELLGNPIRDPHGEPIPTSDLKMPVDSSVTLNNLRPEQQARISRVNAEDPRFLRHAKGLGLVPGAKIKVISYSEYDQNLSVEINQQKAIVLGNPITNRIYVEVIS
jgi:DtxR family transcriptional regulator, Mn-dependent transcriptional regulator